MTSRSFSDQLGNTVSILFPPQRIISLVPSQTELLADLGLQHQVVGITKFCIHPGGWLKNKTIVGGTKKFNFDAIAHLNPDLIIGNKEENDQEGIIRLSGTYPVWMSDIVSLRDALSMITSVGDLVDRKSQATEIEKDIVVAFRQAIKYANQSVLYLIWRDPWMAAGSGTFIHTVLSLLGLRNVAENYPRYPVLSADEIRNLNPDYVFLSSEPYPFREKDVKEIEPLTREAKILLVDGAMFSWYGSRLIKAPGYFNELRDK